jgi:hypothetical protein
MTTSFQSDFSATETDTGSVPIKVPQGAPTSSMIPPEKPVASSNRTPLRANASPYATPLRANASPFAPMYYSFLEQPRATTGQIHMSSPIYDSAQASGKKKKKKTGTLCEDGLRTSIVIQNLPRHFTRDKLFELLEKMGFARDVDFLYVPVDLDSMEHYKFAFVNLTTPEIAQEFTLKVQEFSHFGDESEEFMEVAWSETTQGLEGYIEKYRNSRIMHKSIDDEFKPALYKNGIRIPFPKPTKDIRVPRSRASKMMQLSL